MGSTVRIAAAAGLLAAVTPLLRAQGKFALEQVDGQTNDPLLNVRPVLYGPWPSRPPELVSAPPELAGGGTYFRIPAGGRQVLAVLDGSWPPKLYVDAAGTGNVTHPVPLIAEGPRHRQEFGPVSLRVPGKGGVDIRVRFFISSDGRTLGIRPAGYRAGTVSLGGRTCRAALVDNNLDGRYDAAASFDPRRRERWDTWDLLAIDADQDGKFAPPWQEPGETLPLLPRLHLGAAYYRVQVGAGGSHLELTQVTPRFGTLDTQCPDLVLSVVSDAGFHRFSGSGGRWRLPAGKYMTLRYALAGTDADGVPWTLRQWTGWGASTGNLATFEIRPDEVLTLKAGPPLTGRITARKQPSGEIYMEFLPVGRAGERYAAGARKDGIQQAAPRMRILDRGGKVLVADCFAYE